MNGDLVHELLGQHVSDMQVRFETEEETDCLELGVSMERWRI